MRQEFMQKDFQKYLQYESDTKTWKKFDFAGEDKYDIYEGGENAIIIKDIM